MTFFNPFKKKQVSEERLAEILAEFVIEMIGDDPLGALKGSEPIDKIIGTLSENELSLIAWDMLVLNLFMVTRVCQAFGISDRVLDKMHAYLYNILLKTGQIADNDALKVFEQFVYKRYGEYHASLKSPIAAMSLSRFGDVAVTNMFGEKYPIINLCLPLMIAGIYTACGRAVKEIIKAYPVKH